MVGGGYTVRLVMFFGDDLCQVVLSTPIFDIGTANIFVHICKKDNVAVVGLPFQ